MKKQLFLLVLLLAFFAGTTNVNAQCVPDALHPAVGIEYDYVAIIGGPGYDGTGGSAYDWYITQSLNVIDAAAILTPGLYFTVGGATPYHNGATGVNHILLTWTADALASPNAFYLVLRYREDNATGISTCSAENIRVWQIDPINTFLLALEGGTLNAGTYQPLAGSMTCAADVTAAVVTAGTPGTVTLTYGENSIYYVATASGIQGNWRPAIRLPILAATQTYVAAEWTSDLTGAAGWVAFTGAPVPGDFTSPSDATVTNVNGTSILIRVRLLNNQWQTLADQPITLALDGFLPPTYLDPAGDIIGTGATPCDLAAPFLRTADYTIKARPTITGTPQFLLNTNP